MQQFDDECTSLANFEMLFQKHYKFLCLVACQIVDDLDASKDLVQEFYIDFWKRKDSIQLTGTFQSYATRAVKNLSISYIQKQKLTEAKQNLLQSEESFDPQEDAEYQNNREILDQKVKASIDKLPKECKRIFLQHKQDGLSYVQIAEFNNISINTVKTQIKRAYAYLRHELAEQPLFLLALILWLAKF